MDIWALHSRSKNEVLGWWGVVCISVCFALDENECAFQGLIWLSHHASTVIGQMKASQPKIYATSARQTPKILCFIFTAGHRRLTVWGREGEPPDQRESQAKAAGGGCEYSRCLRSRSPLVHEVTHLPDFVLAGVSAGAGAETEDGFGEEPAEAGGRRQERHGQPDWDGQDEGQSGGDDQEVS